MACDEIRDFLHVAILRKITPVSGRAPCSRQEMPVNQLAQAVVQIAADPVLFPVADPQYFAPSVSAVSSRKMASASFSVRMTIRTRNGRSRPGSEIELEHLGLLVRQRLLNGFPNAEGYLPQAVQEKPVHRRLIKQGIAEILDPLV